jgi:long-chain acyl-CoA synthetase
VIEYFKEAWNELVAPGSGFAMVETEVRGIPMRVFEQAPPNMRAIWELATLHGDKDYLVYEDERLTYNETAALVRALAHHLVNDHGVGRGDRVAIAMRNYPEWVISYWAIASIGAAAVGMNAWWTGPEMEYALDDSRPKVLICDSERLERVAPLLESLRANEELHIIAVRSEGPLPDGAAHWNDVIDPASAPDSLPEVEIDEDDDVTIFYTSGTTGFPKGAQLTHRGSIHNLFNIAFMQMVTASAAAKAQAAAGEAPATDAEPAPELAPSFMAPTPLFHVTACNCLLHPATLLGAKLVLTYKWDPARALELIEREQVTNFSGVPTMSREMLLHPDWQTRDTSSLQGLGGGGAPLQADLVKKIDEALPTGAPSTGYGLTETHGILTANSSTVYLMKPESCGPLVPNVDGKVIDDLGNELPQGERGQLCVKGPIVIKGYINRPEATAESIQDGWFNTGDIAFIDDDGFVFIVDRAKDMVLRGGENVYCSEVETVIYTHPDIAEAAVFGIPDERLGEDVAAAVMLRPGASLSADGLREFLAPLMAKHKIPSTIYFRDQPLPQNANGKFLKRELRDEYLDA